MGRLSRLAVVGEQLRARLPRPAARNASDDDLRVAAAAVRVQIARGEFNHLSAAELEVVQQDLQWVDRLPGP